MVIVVGGFLGCAVAWFFGTIGEWPTGKTVALTALSCLAIGVAMYPLTLRKDGLGYWGVLRKYFF
jgi:hypothetical protein